MTLALPLRNQPRSTEQAFAPATTRYAAPAGDIRIEREADQYIATIVELPMFGEGDSPREAAIDLLRSLMALRSDLQTARRLSPELAYQLGVLNRLLG